MAYDGQLKFDTALDASGLQKGADKMAGLVKGSLVAIGAALAVAAGAVVKLGSGFESAMSGIEAVSGATAGEMDALRKAAIEAGESTVYSASEAANAIEELIKAGLTTEQVLGGGLTGALNLAAAGEIGLADAAEVAATVLNAFRDDGLSVADAANVLAGAANASATDVAGLRMGLSQVSAVASGVGLSFNDTSTALAVFAQNGLKGSDAGTSLKTMLMNLQPVTDKQIGQFQKLGLMTEDGANAFYDMNGKMRPLHEIAGALNTALADMTDQERALALEVMFGSDAIRAANILYKEGESGIKAMWGAMSAVEAADVAATRLDNLKGDIEELSGAAETFGISMYNNFDASLRKAVQGAAEGVRAIADAFKAPNMQNSLKSFAGTFTAAAGVIVKALTVILTNIDKILPVLTTLVGGIAAFKAAVAMESIIKTFSTALKAAAVQATALAAGNNAAASAIVFQTAAEKTLIVAVAAGNVIKAAAATVLGVMSGASITAAASTAGLSAAVGVLGVAIKAMLGPVGLFIALGTALVAAVVAITKALIDGSPANKQYKEEIKDMAEAHEELGDQLGESEKAFEATGPAIEAQAKQSEYLLNKVRELSKVENKSAAQKRELGVYVDRLNEAMGETVAVYDAETDALQIDIKAVQDMIAAKKEMAIANALNERATEIAKELVNVDAELLSIEQKRQQIMEDTALSERERMRRLADLKKVEEDYEATRLEIAARLDAVTSQQVEHDTAAAEAVIENHGRMAQAVTESGDSIADAAELWGVSVDDIQAAMERENISLDEWVANSEAAWEEYTQALGTHSENIINSFKKIPAEYEMSAQDMIDILRANREQYAEWKEAMVEISGQVSAETLAELNKLGPGALSAIKEMQENGGEGLRAFDAEIRGTMEDATNYVASAWNDTAVIDAPSGAIDSSAQMVTENTALDTAMTDTMEGAKAAAEAVDFSVVGQNIAADIVGGLNSADVNGAMANIAAAIQNNTGKVTSAITSMSTSVQTVLRNMKTQATSIATQTMTEINSAIVARSNTVKSSVTSMGNGVITALNTMRTQAATVATQMMTDINSAIVSRTSTIRASATAAANSVVSGLQAMVSGGENVANNMMDGIGAAMDRKAPSLYAKAREIANRIAAIMADALDVNSPSRVMIRLFENVMLGIYEGMDGMSGMLYREAESIADGIADRLTISPGVANALVDQMRTITNSTPLGGAALVPQAAAVGAGGGTTYSPTLVQHITTPKPLSASEMTREGQDMLRRSRWQLP